MGREGAGAGVGAVTVALALVPVGRGAHLDEPGAGAALVPPHRAAPEEALVVGVAGVRLGRGHRARGDGRGGGGGDHPHRPLGQGGRRRPRPGRHRDARGGGRRGLPPGLRPGRARRRGRRGGRRGGHGGLLGRGLDVLGQGAHRGHQPGQGGLKLGQAVGVRVALGHVVTHSHSRVVSADGEVPAAKARNALAVPTENTGDMLFITAVWDGRRERSARLRLIVSIRCVTRCAVSALPGPGAGGFSNPPPGGPFWPPGGVPILNLPAKTRVFYLNLPVWSLLCAPCSVEKRMCK